MTMAAPASPRLWRVICGIGLAACIASTAARAQERFASPEAGVAALIAAMRSEGSRGLYKVLGPSARGILSSGDPVRDASDRKRFIDAFEARHSIGVTSGVATLLVGEEAYPFPIPMSLTKSGWVFLVEAGRREILARRIGRNELDAIQTSLAIVDAQHEYAAQSHDGQAAGAYAQRIVSRPGTRDGLYWPTEAGEAQSPLGEFAARAATEGYVARRTPQPFNGYYFRILKKQGPAAEGGAIDYVANGRMIGGFAVLAYPAEYARSGITSFTVNHSGVVYQKDLGPNTRFIASRMTSFDPGGGWEKVDMKAFP